MTVTPDSIDALLERLGYTPVRELGRGGMGLVLLAEQRSLSRQVAVKVLLPGTISGDAEARFRSEGQVFKELTHPNIVRVFDVGFDPPLPYLVFEYVEGGRTLADLVGKPLDEREAWRLLLGVLRALAYVHERRIVHRDLKPGNVLVTEQGEPKLIDLGLARQLDSTATQQTVTGRVLGTPAYGAPEQLLGEKAQPSADVYAWGLMAIELLSGRGLFSGSFEDAIPFHVRLSSGVPDVSGLLPGLDQVLARTLTRCVSLQPADRPQDAGALVALLEGAAAPVPDIAVQPRRSRGAAPRTSKVTAPAGTPTVTVAGLAPVAISTYVPVRGSRAVVAAAAMAMAVAVGLLIAVWRPGPFREIRPSESPSAPASTATPAAGDAKSPDVALSLELEADGVALVVSAPAETRLRVRWRANGTDEEISRVVPGRLRVRLSVRRLQALRVRAGDVEREAGALLLPHALRLAQSFEQVDWKTTRELARNAAPAGQAPAPSPAALLPAGLVRDLAGLGPVLELLLDTADDALQRRLLSSIWSLEVLDSLLVHRGHPPLTRIADLAGSWGEQIHPASGPANPRASWNDRFDQLSWSLGPVGVLPPEQVVEGEAPSPLSRAVHLLLDTDPDPAGVIQADLNDGSQMPFCRPVVPVDGTKQPVVTRSRRVPARMFREGPNRLRLRFEPHLESHGAERTRPVQVGRMSVLAERALR